MACIRKTTVFCIVFLALYAVFSQIEAVDECFSHSDCTSYYLPYCCDRKFYEDNLCKYSCVGESCSIDSDCAPSESCCSDDTCATTCVGKWCTSDSDCATAESCCSDYTCATTCVGKWCTSDYQCATGESCCSDYTCATTCVGKSCTSDSDCATGECCDDTCKTGDCDVIKGLAGWIIAVIVISVFVVIVVPIAVAVACCCCAATVSRRPAHGGVIVTQPVTTATGTAAVSTQQQPQENLEQGQSMYFQNLQQYPPPPYQPQILHLPGSTDPPTEMTPQTLVKQY